MNVFDEINRPYSHELKFYRDNNIPLWECQIHKSKDLGVIYKEDPNINIDTSSTSYIKAKVTCLPAQFWEFEVYSNDDKKLYKISTGSGGLSTYFDTLIKIAENMIVVNEIKDLSQS